jgi:hypothetical protein
MGYSGTFQTSVGLGRELIAGTAPASVGVWLPVSKIDPKENIKFFEDKAFRGLRAESFGHYPLGGFTDLGVDGPFYPDSTGLLLYAAHGADTVTVAPSAVTTNLISVAGASTLTYSVSPPGFVNGMAFMIDTGANQEVNMIFSGGGTVTWTLAAPLRVAHAAGVSTAGATLHQFKLAATPPTLSVWDFFGIDWRLYTYGAVSDFGLKWTAEMDVTHSSKIVSQLSSIPSSPTSSFTTVPAFVGWSSGALIAGAQKLNLETLDLTVKNNVKPIFTATNSQSPTLIFVGSQMVTGKATFAMKDETEYNLFRNNTKSALAFALFGFSPGATAASGCMFQMTNPTYTLAQIDRAKEYVEVSIDFAADYNATDGGGLTTFLSNAVTAY